MTVLSSVSLPSVGSFEVLTVAVFESVPGVPGAVTLMSLLTVSPASTVPSSHVTVTGSVLVLVQLAGSDPLSITPFGRVSLTCTPVAVPAPMALVTSRV